MSDASRGWLPLDVRAASASDIGRNREHNEDSVLLRPDLALYLLADGAGGHNAGNVASALATTTIANYMERYAAEPADEIDPFGTPRALRRLATALHEANKDILEIARSSNKLKGMGSTVVAALADPKSGLLHVAHVGDSRLYRLRDSALEQLTVDHSLHNDALEMRPDVGDDVLARMPRNVVTRALGMDASVRATARSHRMFAGDKYLICSDGLTDVLADDDIQVILSTPDRPESIGRSLVQAALGANAADNIAVVVIECELSSRAAAPVKKPPVRHSPPPPSRAPQDSAPEIIILDVQELRLDVGSAGLVMVPAQSKTDTELLSAIEQVVATYPSEPPGSDAPDIEIKPESEGAPEIETTPEIDTTPEIEIS
jgi:PPM family protein phosphatase